jgi:uncharacterized protein (DUF58 family)
MSFSPLTYYFLGAVAVAGIAGQWLGGAWATVWRVPAALLVLAVFIEYYRLRRRRFSLDAALPARLMLGRQETGTIRLVNQGGRALHVETAFQPDAGLAEETLCFHWRMTPHGEDERHFSVLPRALGRRPVGRLYARVLGDFGLIWWPRRVELAREIDVVPDAWARTAAGPGLSRRGGRQYRLQTGRESGTELMMIRDYQGGDPMHLIDWKATARAGAPKVRVFSPEQQIELVVLLDAGRGSLLQSGRLSRLHHYANIAARLAEAALAAGDRVGLISFADVPLHTTPVGRGRHTLLAVREHLRRLESHPAESNPLFAALKLRSLLKHRGLVVFLTEIAEAEAASQLIRATALLTPKHIPLIAGVMDEHIEQMKHRDPEHWLDPYRSYAACEYTQAVRRSALQLQRLGGHVVLAAPAELDRQVMMNYERLRHRRRV